MNSLSVKNIKPQHLVLAVLLVVVFTLPLWLESYPLHLITVILMYVFMAQAWNISGGFTGSFSFLHPVFIGAGAYTSTLLFIHLGVSPWIGMFAGAAISVILSTIINGICLRAKVTIMPFALITIAFVFVFMFAADSFASLGGGDRGVQIPYQPGIGNFMFTTKFGYFITILIALVLIMTFMHFLFKTRLGLRFRALKDNPRGSEAVGVGYTKYILITNGISAAFISFGGTFYAQFIGSLLPSTAISFHAILVIVLGAAVGGVGTLWGPVVGIGLLMPVGEILRTKLPQYQSLHLLLYGIIVVGVLVAIPHGIVPLIEKRIERAKLRRHALAREAARESAAGGAPAK